MYVVVLRLRQILYFSTYKKFVRTYLVWNVDAKILTHSAPSRILTRAHLCRETDTGGYEQGDTLVQSKLGPNRLTLSSRAYVPFLAGPSVSKFGLQVAPS